MRNSSIEIMPMTGGLGAEIGNVDLATAGDATYIELRQALADHGVIVFRDQKISPAQFRHFGTQFGALTVTPFIPALAGFTDVQELKKEPEQTHAVGGGWHTDSAYRQVPVFATVLHAKEIPDFGGDTLFVNMAAAYEGLSPGLKHTLEGLRAIHSNAHVFGAKAAAKKNNGLVNTEAATHEGNNPVVISHAGKKVLYVNQTYTVRFDGWTEQESRALLDYLFQHAKRPEFHCRLTWAVDTLAIWDNRQTWHYAINDYNGKRRVMHRMIIAGEPMVAASAAAAPVAA